MKNNKKQGHFASLLLICLVAFTSCKMISQEPASKDVVISKDLKWSERMALTIMKNHEKPYMIDDAKEPKWDYVHGLVLKSFEVLYKQNKDQKYYNYIKDYVDTFVQEDGSIKTYDFDN